LSPLDLGYVSIEYNPDGTVREASFVPTMVVPVPPAVHNDLMRVGRIDDIVALQGSADIIMASWFSKVNEIELAERTEYTIKSTISKCVRNEDGRVKNIVIGYRFEPVQKPVANG
jgi:hypothetical protein